MIKIPIWRLIHDFMNMFEMILDKAKKGFFINISLGKPTLRTLNTLALSC